MKVMDRRLRMNKRKCFVTQEGMKGWDFLPECVGMAISIVGFKSGIDRLPEAAGQVGEGNLHTSVLRGSKLLNASARRHLLQNDQWATVRGKMMLD